MTITDINIIYLLGGILIGGIIFFRKKKRPIVEYIYVDTTGIDINPPQNYIDVEQKTLNFSGDVSDVWINYGAQVPLPIVLSNITSINTYGGPNKKPHYQVFFITDIK